MFKRRDKRSVLKIAQESLYPKGGWGRAASYVVHRLRRLPDPPDRIARGIASGVFISFTPFFGLHFIFSGIVAVLIRGNLFAAMLSTFFGNPITFPIIAAFSIRLGNAMLGTHSEGPVSGVFEAFSRASSDLWWNFTALFYDREANWEGLGIFFDSVFLPYLIGGLIPGLIAGFTAYYLSKPLIAAYQRRRARMLKRST
ncbi:MAG: DUF2062 domain-containing protein [Pseudomonadota bacterium]